MYIVFPVLCSFTNTNFIKSFLNSMCNKTLKCKMGFSCPRQTTIMKRPTVCQMERLFLVDDQFLSTHNKLLIFMLAVWCSHLVSIDLGGAFTCQDDIISLMNIAFLQDYSKYNSLFEKVKEDTFGHIVFLVLC